MSHLPVQQISDLLVSGNAFIVRFSEWAPVIPLSIGLYRWRSLSRALQVLVLNYAFWVAQTPLNIWSRVVLHTNMYLHHFDTFLETWLLALVYYQGLSGSRLRPWIPRLLVGYSIIAIADATVLNGIYDFNPYSRAAQTLLMLCLLLWYFEHWLRRFGQPRRNYEGLFLVSVGLTIYFTGSLTGYMFLAPRFGLYIQLVSGTLIGIMDSAGLAFAARGLWRDQRPYEYNVAAPNRRWPRRYRNNQQPTAEEIVQ